MWAIICKLWLKLKDIRAQWDRRKLNSRNNQKNPAFLDKYWKKLNIKRKAVNIELIT